MDAGVPALLAEDDAGGAAADFAGRRLGTLALHLRHSRAALLHVYFGHIGVHLLPYLRKARLPVIVSFHGADAGIDVTKRVAI